MHFAPRLTSQLCCNPNHVGSWTPVDSSRCGRGHRARVLMLAKLKPLLPILALASCGANGQANRQSASRNATPAKLELTSSAFANGQSIPHQFTCDGAGLTPPPK